MATTTEMKRPFCIGMKIADNRYKVFQIINWHVRGELNLEGSTCDCTMHKLKSECDHSNMIAAANWGTKGRAYPHWTNESTDWREAPAFSRLVVWSGEDDLMEAGLRQIGDVGIAGLAELFSEGVHLDDVDGRDAGTEEDRTFLNPKRIYAECQAALSGGGLSILDCGVSDVGEAISPSFGEPLDIASEPKDEDVSNTVSTEAPKPVDVDSLPVWDSRKTPKPELAKFYVDTDVWEQILYSLSTGKNVLLTGPSGSGKSELAYIAAKALDTHLEAFNMGAMSEPRTSLIGNTHFDAEKGTWFDQSRFAKTVQNESGVVLLDEVTRSEPGAFNILMPLMDRQGYLPLDESEDGQVIQRGENVAFIATANVGMEYTGTMAMDKALKDRFAVTIDMEFPPEENEVEVLMGRCEDLKKSDAKRLVGIAVRQREMSRDGEFIELISTRMLLETGEQVAAGVPFRTACKFCIENQFSGEGGDASDRTKIRQIIQKDA
jgi:energy-coupling factor transporter ATP-binding protein EcfA2